MTTRTAKQIRAELLKANEDLEEAQNLEPFIEQAETILAKMEKDMPLGMQWLARMKAQVEKEFVVMSPIGRPRRLWRAATKLGKSIGDAGRRAKNSPVQGLSSEVGVVSGYLSYTNTYLYSKRSSVQAVLEDCPLGGTKAFSKISRLVHDASYYNTPYELVLPQIQIGLWSSTIGTAQYYKEHFGFDMLAAPEVELEMCAREDTVYKWDYTIPELFRIIRASLEDQKAMGLCDDVDEAMSKVFWCWADPKEREYLWGNYPVLNVPLAGGVNKQIRAALKEYKIV